MEGKFASRAGEKLDHALTEFGLDVTGKVCADLGCSTGGFTDCLLKRGAAKVYSVDTARGTLRYRLIEDKRVVYMERTNALHVELPEKMDIIVIDVGWTPQRLIIPHALELLKDDGDIVSLIKPHYEADKEWMKGGHLREEFVDKAIEKGIAPLKNCQIKKIVKSPLLGSQGKNPEFLAWIRANHSKRAHKNPEALF